MILSHDHTSLTSNLVIVCVLACLLTSCSTVGPAVISNGRTTYNEAIVETDNQQMLMVAIHNRYEERGNLLAVASVTANVSVRTSAGIQLGFGNDSNYAGNLVPFTAGTIYEENPTISYTPVGGQKYMRHLFAPIPVTAFAQLVGRVNNPASIYMALISSVNGIHNPDFLLPGMEPDPRFSRFVMIMSKITAAYRLHWVEDFHQGGLSIVIDRSGSGFETEISELLDLLGLTAAIADTPTVILPISLALDGRATGEIGITMRSVWNLVELLSAAIQVPEEDQRNHVAVNYPTQGLVGKALRVRNAKARPEDAYVAVQHRENWFYIDEKDQATKRFFRLLGDLLHATIAESTANSSIAPVLTVPVSR